MSSTADPFKYFRIEAREILDELGRGVMLLDKEPGEELVARLLRLVHTLKGAARVVKQGTIAEQAHAVEDVMGPLRAPGGALRRDDVATLLGLVDAMAANVKALDPPKPHDAARAEPIHALRADVGEMDSLLEGLSEAAVQVRSLRRTSEAVARARRLSDLLLDQVASGSTSAAPNARLRSLAQDVRSAMTAVERELGAGIDLVERELGDVRDVADRLRLVPTSTVFGVLERVAHDAAGATHRRISFTARGGDIRLDAHVLGAVQNALVQLVRNAVAHGIEDLAARTRKGKDPVGRVEITIVRRGSRVAFVCSDDGRGFDIEAVRAVAARRGVPAASGLGERDILQLLFRGGLTTSGDVTQVAGRGIGLDVVREVASALGGAVDVENVPGRGARIELVVPTSLASMDVLLLDAAAEIVAVPLDAVTRTMGVSDAEVANTATGETMVSDGQVIPLVTLSRLLGARGRPSTRGVVFSAIVIQGAAARAAFRVDRLVGIARVVVRSLPPTVRADAFVAGATLDAEGNPRLVLDPANLVAAAVGGLASSEVDEHREPLPILVIDDSLTTRRLEQSILESAGYRVDLATSAEEGLSKARAARYELFLVDVEMPGMDGFGFIEATRNDPLLREIPSILVTSRSGPEDRRRGEAAGARGFIAKGEFDQAELLETIRRLRG